MTWPDPWRLVLFSGAAALIVLTPGPVVLYIVTRSIEQGRLAGIVSALGVSAATVLHIGAAVVGVSALVRSSVLAFDIITLLGAAVLVYLGIQRFRSPDGPKELTSRSRANLRRVFSEGMLVHLLNPKAAMFFFAFLPQFVDPVRGGVGQQIVVLGVVLMVIGFGSDAVYALVAGSMGRWLKERRAFSRGLRFVAGSALIALGITAALAGSALGE